MRQTLKLDGRHRTGKHDKQMAFIAIDNLRYIFYLKLFFWKYQYLDIEIPLLVSSHMMESH